MLNLKNLIMFWHNDKLEAAIFIITFILIIITNDLIKGIEIGLILSFMIISLRLLATKISINFGSDKNVARISLSGNMTFLAFDKLNNLETQILKQQSLQFVIFEFNNLSGLDTTAAKQLIDLVSHINNHKIKVIFHGLTAVQQKQLNLQLNYGTNASPFIITITENEIKNILEASSVRYFANDILKHGVAQFQNNYVINNPDLINALAKEQNPHTLLITCADSRLNPNAFFSVGLGEIFIVRNVGNVIPPYAKDSKYSEGAAIEFALDVLKIRNVIICAHTECGAIKASISNLNTNSHSGLDNWLQLIKSGFSDLEPHTVNAGVEINLLNQITHLKTYPNVKQLLDSKELTISAWIYDVHSAHMLEWSGKSFVPISDNNSEKI